MTFIPPTDAVVAWLLDSDPAIRWQVKRDLLNETADDVADERARIAVEGWGKRLLKLQDSDGSWGGGTWMFDDWTSTFETLAFLREFGIDPSSAQTRQAIGLVRENSDWGPWHHNSPFFQGESEQCINGRVLAMGAYFGEAPDRLVDRLLEQQLDDGGWNCDAPSSNRSSFNTTICVLEGLLEYERANGSSSVVRDARLRGEEYLLDRHLFRSLSTGEVIGRDRKGGTNWADFAFPMRWHYDVLWGLDYMRKAGVKSDARVDQAIDLVLANKNNEGLWPLGPHHEGKVHFDLERGEDSPSRWNTLRALRVLKWFHS